MKLKFRKPPVPVVSHQRKINWLLRHPKVWEGFPNDAGVARWNHTEQIFLAMQKARLYSPRTNWVDAAIVSLISDARRVRRERAYQTATGKPYVPKN